MRIRYKMSFLRSYCTQSDLQRWFPGLLISLEWWSFQFWSVLGLFYKNSDGKSFSKVPYLPFLDFGQIKDFVHYFRVPCLEFSLFEILSRNKIVAYFSRSKNFENDQVYCPLDINISETSVLKITEKETL